MFKWGIRNRLIVSCLTLVLITLLLLGSYILFYFYRHNLHSLTTNLLTQTNIIEELLLDRMRGPQEKAGIDSVIKELSTKVNLRVTVIEPDGTVLADSWENPALMENHSQRPEVMAAITSGYGTSIRFSGTLGQNLLYVATPIRQNTELIGVLRVSTTLLHVEQGFSEIRSALFAAFFMASLLAVLMSIRLARKYTAPLEEITAVAQQIAHGQFDKRLHIRTGDEIELLAHTLNNLASNLDDKVNVIVAEKSKLELILLHTNSCVLLLDRYGQVTSANKAAIETFSIKPAMFGLHNIQVIGNSHFDKAVHEVINQRVKANINLKTDIKSDKRAFQVFLAPIVANDGEIASVLAVFHDITALTEVQEKQAEFIANASHELATPLTAIKGFAETLLDGAGKDPELSTRFVSIIHTEAERMHRLVKDLLQMAKLDSQDYRKGVILEPTPLEPLFTAAVTELSPHWQKKELTIAVNAPPEPIAVLANPDWVKQVILNLLDNSIKYTPPAGSIQLSWRQEESEAVVSVQDTGIGIPAQDLPRIFDRFYRVDRARARTAGGTGLGLAIVKFIVEMFNGTIEAKSDVGVGTTITFRLPVAK